MDLLADPQNKAQAGEGMFQDRPAPFGVAGLAALLMGSGACLLLTGLTERFEVLFATAGIGRLVTAAGVFSVAIGSLVPQRAAEYLGRRWRGSPFEQGFIQDDVPLLWTVLALVSLLSGLAVAAVPLALALLEGGYDWVLERFLWSPRSLTSLQLLTVVSATLPGLVLLGLALSCTCRLACRACRWRVLPLGWALVGVGIGSGLIDVLLGMGAAIEVLTTAAALPVLVVALLSARQMGRTGSFAEGAARSRAAVSCDLPDVRDRWPLLIRLSVAWVAASTAVVVVVWVEVWRRWSGVTGSGMGAALMCLPAMVGAGVVLCERSRPSRSYSAGGLGVACAVSGVGLAAWCSLPALWLTGGSGAVVPASVLLLAGGLSALSMGYALAYGHRMVLGRVGSRAAGGGALLFLSLAAAAVVVLLIGRPSAGAKSSYTTLAAMALSLLALGGTAIIHEPAYSPRTRRWRLAAVFASIGLMFYFLPIAGRRWSGSQSSDRVADVPASVTPELTASVAGAD